MAWAARNMTIAVLIIVCETVAGCVVPSSAPPVYTVIVEGTPVVMKDLSGPPREGPLTTPTYAPTSTPAFWPTGMPPPTRGPDAAKPDIPTDKETCLDAGGLWDQHPCMRGPGEPQTCWEVPTTDAGQTCSDSSECQGWCDPNLTWDEAWNLAKGAPADPGPLMTGTCSRVAKRHDMTTLELREGRILAIQLGCE